MDPEFSARGAAISAAGCPHAARFRIRARSRPSRRLMTTTLESCKTTAPGGASNVSDGCTGDFTTLAPKHNEAIA